MLASIVNHTPAHRFRANEHPAFAVLAARAASVSGCFEQVTGMATGLVRRGSKVA